MILLQYVEHHYNYDKAKVWMEENLSDEMLSLHLKGMVVWGMFMQECDWSVVEYN